MRGTIHSALQLTMHDTLFEKAVRRMLFRELLPLAEQGDAAAQHKLGVMYDNGEGILVNKAEAVKWYRKAAEQGHEGAQIRLALMFRHGWGVSKDVAEAEKWYRKAAEQGDADAQYWLEKLQAK